jgi:hypothetical protein
MPNAQQRFCAGSMDSDLHDDKVWERIGLRLNSNIYAVGFLDQRQGLGL